MGSVTVCLNRSTNSVIIVLMVDPIGFIFSLLCFFLLDFDLDLELDLDRLRSPSPPIVLKFFTIFLIFAVFVEALLLTE